MRVLKYEIPVLSHLENLMRSPICFAIWMQKHAVLRRVGTQVAGHTTHYQTLHVWATAHEDMPIVQRTILVVGTGVNIPEAREPYLTYIGSVEMVEGEALHIFDAGEQSNEMGDD